VRDSDGPSVANVEASPNPAQIGMPVALTATLSDTETGCAAISSAEYSLDGGATWAVMQAADGSFDSAVENGAATVAPFSSADVQQVCVRAIDAADNTGAPVCILLAVYDPSAGFVTGAGAIDSGPGTCPVLAPDASGTAIFGFIARYARGATTPSGDTKFKFAACSLTFESDAYEWLVVAGTSGMAQFKGTGTVNGNPGYNFLLTAYDAAVTGIGTDGFRLKITESWGTVLYDNKEGTDDRNVAANTEPLALGNIIVHPSKH